jgi:hypothetical protein
MSAATEAEAFAAKLRAAQAEHPGFVLVAVMVEASTQERSLVYNLADRGQAAELLRSAAIALDGFTPERLA